MTSKTGKNAETLWKKRFTSSAGQTLTAAPMNQAFSINFFQVCLHFSIINILLP